MVREKKKKMRDKICSVETCKKEFSTNISTQTRCPDCIKEIKTHRARVKKSPQSTLNVICEASTGAVSELRACAYFMEQGYYVFRNVAPNSPFDLVIFRPGEQLLKVEVASSRYNPDGSPYVARKPDHYDFDILCLVMRNGNVELVTREQYLTSLALKTKKWSPGKKLS